MKENPIEPGKRVDIVARRKTDPPGTNIPTRSVDRTLLRLSDILSECRSLLDSIREAQKGSPL